MHMTQTKYYAVFQGRKTGIFTTWAECERQVKGFSQAIYKSFKTKKEAETAMEEFQGNTSILPWQSKAPKENIRKKDNDYSAQVIADSISVDASCLGNPGDVEYRGVHTTTKELIFHIGPLKRGTNNLGEFLAIVEGLIYLKKENKNIPIYSDSKTAMLWVKNKTIKTTLRQTSENQEIFKLVDRALNWLENNFYTTPILKWDTVGWGEIPADFGRK